MRQGSQHEPVAWRTPTVHWFINIVGDYSYQMLFRSIELSAPGQTFLVILRNGQNIKVRRK